MRIRHLFAALPVLVLGLAGLPADGQAKTYISGNVGAVFVQDADLTETGPGVSGTGEFEFDTGYGVNAALGYSLDGLRLEAELSYRQADFDQLSVDSITVAGFTITGLGSFDVDGDTSALGLMGNVWYDFDTGGKLRPFIGGGIGLARVDIDVASVGGAPVGLSDHDYVFAYQAGAGVGYEISSNTVATLGYRFFGTSDPEFNSGGFTDETEVRTHNIELGLRFRF